jgi:EAL domain-containing protein (putative c-di-GMP-specific phosphodiesterase class I)
MSNHGPSWISRPVEASITEAPAMTSKLALVESTRIAPRRDVDRRTVVLAVAAQPEAAASALAEAVTSTTQRLLGHEHILEIASNGPTVVLTLAVEGPGAHRVVDPAMPAALEVELAASLSERGVTGASVSVVTAGGAHSWSSRVEELWRDRLTSLRNDAFQQADAAAVRREIAEMVETGGIRTVFQPIVNVADSQVMGYESLSRGPPGHRWERPDVLLAAAGRAGMTGLVEWEMLRLARIRALKRIDDPNHSLFINAPDTRFWPDAPPNVDESPDGYWPWSRIVLEVTERTPIDNRPAVWAFHEQTCQRGARYALDDVGAGYAGLAALAMLAPDFLKIDMSLVRDCDRDPMKRAVIGALTQYAERSGVSVIAEGIETARELSVVRELGVTLGQGFLLGFPVEFPQ